VQPLRRTHPPRNRTICQPFYATNGKIITFIKNGKTPNSKVFCMPTVLFGYICQFFFFAQPNYVNAVITIITQRSTCIAHKQAMFSYRLTCGRQHFPRQKLYNISGHMCEKSVQPASAVFAAVSLYQIKPKCSETTGLLV